MIRRHIADAFRRAADAFAYLSSKKYTTLAGTMTFFLILSVVPFLFWLTFLFGRLEIDFDRILDLEIFAEFKDILHYLREQAQSAQAGASVILLATTLYSSTNLFYHMRRSGEIIYGCGRDKGGLALRISAVALVFVVMLLGVAGAALRL